MNEIQPELLVATVRGLREEMKTVKRLLWTLVAAVIGSGASLTVTLLSQLGGTG